MLGFEISGGAHEEFLGRLGDQNSGLAKVLDGWSQGLAKRTSEELRRGWNRGPDIGGFEPRLRAVPNPYLKDGTPHLSNHAFGCAIDVDATWNPQIIGGDLITVLREITAMTSVSSGCLKRRTYRAWIRYAQIYLLQSDPSDRLKEWLNKYLHIYEENEVELAVPLKPGDNSREELYRSSHGSCRELNATTADAMYKIQELRRLRGLDTIRGWAKHGIQNFPVTFVAGMAKIGLKWGSCYGGSKDIMHFELIAQGTADGAFVQPDSPRRPLRALLVEWGLAGRV